MELIIHMRAQLAKVRTMNCAHATKVEQVVVAFETQEASWVLRSSVWMLVNDYISWIHILLMANYSL